MLGDTLLEYVYLGTSRQLLEDLKDLKVESSIDRATIQKEEQPEPIDQRMDLEPEGLAGVSPEAETVRKSLLTTLMKYVNALKSAETDGDVQDIVNRFFSLMHSQMGAKEWKEKGGKSAGREGGTDDTPKPPPPRNPRPSDTMESVDFDIIELLESVKKELARKDKRIGSLTESIKKKDDLIKSKEKKPKRKTKSEQAKPLISERNRKRLEFNCGLDIYGEQDEKE